MKISFLLLSLALRYNGLRLNAQQKEPAWDESLYEDQMAKYVVDVMDHKGSHGLNFKDTSEESDLHEDSFDEGQEQLKALFAKEGGELPEQIPTLAGKHVVFVGDSTLRYQYLNLAHHVAHGTPPPWQMAKMPKNETEKDAADAQKDYRDVWQKFYQSTNRILKSGNNTDEICDCARKDAPRIDVMMGLANKLDGVTENRYFTDSDKQISLSYYQWFSDLYPFKGHWTPASGYPIKTGCNAGDCHGYWWNIVADGKGAVKLLEQHVMKLKPTPTHVVMNRGIWGELKQKELEIIFQEGQDLNEKYGTKFIWKTQMHSKGQTKDKSGHITRERDLMKNYRGWTLFDAYNLTEKVAPHKWAFYDVFHVRVDVDNYLNHEFLSILP